MISMPLSEVARVSAGTLYGEDVEFSGCTTDSRNVEKNQLFIALKGEHFDGHEYSEIAVNSGVKALLLEKKTDLDTSCVIVEDTRKAMGALANAWRQNFSIPLVAITGSNGKTTVKEMLAAILKQKYEVLVTKGNLNNDIGVPLTLYQLGEEHEYAVIEMGANHPGEIDYLSAMAMPQVAVITQCAPAHLEGFGSIEGVAKAKSEIFNGLLQEGTAVINADDKYAEFWTGRSSQHEQITFAINNKADVYASDIQQLTSAATCKFSLHANQQSVAVHLNLAGKHNVMNALAAASCAIALQIDLETIRDGLGNMQAVNGRLQVKQGQNDCLLIDDTYNANPTSLKAAIEVLGSLGKTGTLVLGDMGELGDDAEAIHATAGQQAANLKVDRLLGFGELAKHAVENFTGDGQHFSDMDDLINYLKNNTSGDDAILIKGSRSMKMERVVNALLAGKKT